MLLRILDFYFGIVPDRKFYCKECASEREQDIDYYCMDCGYGNEDGVRAICDKCENIS